MLTHVVREGVSFHVAGLPVYPRGRSTCYAPAGITH